MCLTLLVAQEVLLLVASPGFEGAGSVYHQDATEPQSRAVINVIVLHLLSTRPHPLTSQETQARPHLSTFSRET